MAFTRQWLNQKSTDMISGETLEIYTIIVDTDPRTEDPASLAAKGWTMVQSTKISESCVTTMWMMSASDFEKMVDTHHGLVME